MGDQGACTVAPEEEVRWGASSVEVAAPVALAEAALVRRSGGVVVVCERVYEEWLNRSKGEWMRRRRGGEAFGGCCVSRDDAQQVSPVLPSVQSVVWSWYGI